MRIRGEGERGIERGYTHVYSTCNAFIVNLYSEVCNRKIVTTTL